MRYYTLCEFTASVKNYRRNYSRVWAGAPDAFLFHDTEAPLSIEHIRKALFILSELHLLNKEDAAPATTGAALAVRVDAQTIAATFSMRGFPKPASVIKWNQYLHTKTEWLIENNLQGWRIATVKDSSEPAVAISFSEFYDQCTQLPRLMGECPCPLADTGDCARTLVWPQLPPVFQTPEVHNSHYTIDTKVLSRKRYASVDGFAYVSSSKTTETDFTEARRPWDNHDFSCVEDRSKELSTRGKIRQVNNRTRKQQCVSCAFKLKSWVPSKGDYTTRDCGQIDSCKGGVTEDQAMAALHHWYENASDFYKIDGFTRAERDQLIRLAGSSLTVKCLYESRKTKTVYGGFMRYGGAWTYRMVGASGDLAKCRAFKSYEELQQALSSADIPLASPDKTLVPVTPRQSLVYALVASHRSYAKPYGGNHYVRLVTLDGNTVNLESASGRYVMSRVSLDVHDPARQLVRWHPHWTYDNMLYHYNASVAAATDTKLHLPVTTE